MSDAASSSRPGISSLPASFWVANVMELFERAAYYGMNAVLIRYLTDTEGGGLGFKPSDASLLQSIVYALVYLGPIVGGALADRYGYRRMLLVAFSLLTWGYVLSGSVSSYAPIFATLLLMALGAGLFKPIISGTIARTTNERNSGFGFGVYYWMINVGALVAPIVVLFLRTQSWRYVFLASAAYTALMLLPALFVYRDPPLPASRKSIREVLGGAAVVLTDARFMLMIVVYSGFWILYFQNFGTVLLYLHDFVDAGPVNALIASSGINELVGMEVRFDAEFVTIINACTIVLLQVAVSFLTAKTKPLPTMVAGMCLGACGFFCLALSQGVWIFIAGIVVFSLGEMTAHPKYYSYVGMVAPEDKKAVYMGYAFLYGVIGSLFGANLGGGLYEKLLTPLAGQTGTEGTTRGFWLFFAVLGALSAVGMLVYNRLFGRDTAESRRRARAVMLAIYSLLVAASLAFGVHAGLTATADDPPWKMIVQALMLLGMGGAGLYANLRQRDPVQQAASAKPG